MNIGGRALKNGIMLQSDNGIVFATQNKNTINFEIIKFGHTKKLGENILNKIPLIRGVYNFFFVDGNLFSRIIIIFGLFLEIFGFNIKSSNNNYLSYSYIILSLIFCITTLSITIYNFKNIKSILQYHGAEHKIINAVEQGIPININNVKKCNRISYGCGTIFIIFVLICYMIINIISHKLIVLNFILSIAIAEELYMSDFLYRYGVKYLFVLGGYIQKHITTLEPDDEQLQLGIACLNKLKEFEK